MGRLGLPLPTEGAPLTGELMTNEGDVQACSCDPDEKYRKAANNQSCGPGEDQNRTIAVHCEDQKMVSMTARTARRRTRVICAARISATRVGVAASPVGRRAEMATPATEPTADGATRCAKLRDLLPTAVGRLCAWIEGNAGNGGCDCSCEGDGACVAPEGPCEGEPCSDPGALACFNSGFDDSHSGVRMTSGSPATACRGSSACKRSRPAWSLKTEGCAAGAPRPTR